MRCAHRGGSGRVWHEVVYVVHVAHILHVVHMLGGAHRIVQHAAGSVFIRAAQAFPFASPLLLAFLPILNDTSTQLSTIHSVMPIPACIVCR